MDLLQKCKHIVNMLHFRTEIMESKVLNINNQNAAAEFLNKIAAVKEALDADDQTELDNNGENGSDNDDKSDREDDVSNNRGTREHKVKETMINNQKKFHRLQNEVNTLELFATHAKDYGASAKGGYKCSQVSWSL